MKCSYAPPDWWTASSKPHYETIRSSSSNRECTLSRLSLQIGKWLIYTRMTSPQPGTVVVNVADLLARWSNDVLRSTLHRVVAPSQPVNESEVVTPKRQSIAFFCSPNFDVEISCLPHCSGPGNPRKYDPVITEEYIVRRVRETYT